MSPVIANCTRSAYTSKYMYYIPVLYINCNIKEPIKTCVGCYAHALAFSPFFCMGKSHAINSIQSHSSDFVEFEAQYVLLKFQQPYNEAAKNGLAQQSETKIINK